MIRTTAILMSMACAATAADWIPLFDGKTLNGWLANAHPEAWSVRDGCLVARGPRNHLFYVGPVSRHDFTNFEMEVEARTEPGANSGVFFHTQFEKANLLTHGYEVQLDNTYTAPGKTREWKRTGSLYAVRAIAPSFVKDGDWFRVRVRVTGRRIRVHVNDQLAVDYLQPDAPVRAPARAGRLLSHGTIALQCHDGKSVVSFRRIAIRALPDDADASQPPRASDTGYGLAENDMDRLGAGDMPFIDYHIHLRGGMTVEKAVERQAVTGIGAGVLRNIGKGWPIETDAQLRTFLDSVANRPVFVGLQVNDRDWHKHHAPEQLARLDYVLGDTMIMPMPTDDGPPTKLWIAEGYSIDDVEAWMDRYVAHNLRVLAEPITILANPTYLPPAVKDRYDELWTEARMERIIRAAVDNHVALEINAGSGYPHDRFIRMAKALGAKFTFGSNNFDDKPHDMSRCVKAIETYGLTPDDMYVPRPCPPRTPPP